MNKPTTRIALEVIQRRAQWQVAHIRDFKARNETPGDVTDAGADGREGFLPPDFRKRLSVGRTTLVFGTTHRNREPESAHELNVPGRRRGGWLRIDTRPAFRP